MRVSFLTPEVGLVALAALLPLVALLDGERKTRRVRAALGLAPPTRSRRGQTVVALVGAPLLVALATMQPVVDRSVDHVTRTDAEIYFVIDVSRSMVASRTPRSPTRLERARAAAIRVRSDLGDVPAGVATLTDRLLPHLFPTPDAQVFTSTVERAVGIDQPPPVNYNRTATTLGSLAALATKNFYTPQIKRRVAVVFTDAESRPFASQTVGAIFRREPRVYPIFVRIGDQRERVFSVEGVPEDGYRPDTSAPSTALGLAAATGGKTFGEGELAQVTAAVKRAIGRGKTEVRGDERNKLPLAPYIVALAFAPLGLLLWRRNL